MTTRTPRRRDDEVLAAAARVFYEHGYADASVQDVAEELGILKGSLYHYISTKEDLLFRLLSETHGDVSRILDEVRDTVLDAQMLARCVFATIIWTYKWYRPGCDGIGHVAESCADFA